MSSGVAISAASSCRQICLKLVSHSLLASPPHQMKFLSYNHKNGREEIGIPPLPIAADEDAEAAARAILVRSIVTYNERSAEEALLPSLWKDPDEEDDEERRVDVTEGRKLQSQAWTQRGQTLFGEKSAGCESVDFGDGFVAEYPWGGDAFGSSISLSDDGTVMAVGAPYNDASSFNGDYGRVRVLKFVNGSWTLLGGPIDGEATGDYSGWSVSLSIDGAVLAVGAVGNDPGGRTDAGHVRVYKYVNGAWTQLGSGIDGEAAGDNSGRSVSLSGNGEVLAVGAAGNDPGDRTDAGHVRVYRYASNAWIQLGSDIDGDIGTSGWSVSLSSNGIMLAVGAPNYSYFNPYPTNFLYKVGLVRVYQYVNGAWTQHGIDIVGEAAEDAFGWSVSLSGNGEVLAVGARSSKTIVGLNCPFYLFDAAGKVRVFQNNAVSLWHSKFLSL